MQYAEHIPVIALQPYVKCIWFLESATTGYNQPFEKILPDGCTELIFHFATPFEKKQYDAIHRQENCFVYGQLSKYIELRSSFQSEVMGIRFHPFGLAAFTTIPQYQLTDGEVAVENIFSHFTGCLYEQLATVKTQSEKINIISHFLFSNLILTERSFKQQHLQGIQYAVQQIRQTHGAEKINAIAGSLNISNRELERRFSKYVGLTPKQLSKTFRFQQVLQKKYLRYTLTDIAHLSGYYDQPHFIRDFRAFAGEQPGNFFRQENSFADFFVTR